MPSLAILVLAGVVLGADCGDPRVPCVQDGNPIDNAASVPMPGDVGLPPGPAVDWRAPEPPWVPRGAWWYGGRVPVPYQRHVYYPTWDTPVRLLIGLRPMGTPAVEVPQRPAAPAFWKPLYW
jgi:hypothetical protein